MIDRTLQDKSADWILNLISIREGKSYFVARNALSQKKFQKLLGVKFDDGIASTSEEDYYEWNRT